MILMPCKHLKNYGLKCSSPASAVGRAGKGQHLEMVTGGPVVQGHSWLQSKLKVTQDYETLVSKTKTKSIRLLTSFSCTKALLGLGAFRVTLRKSRLAQKPKKDYAVRL